MLALAVKTELSSSPWGSESRHSGHAPWAHSDLCGLYCCYAFYISMLEFNSKLLRSLKIVLPIAYFCLPNMVAKFLLGMKYELELI